MKNNPQIESMSRKVLLGARTLSVLLQALREAFSNTHRLNACEIQRIGDLACKVTRKDAWSRAIFMTAEEMREMATARAERYTNADLLPGWILDIIRAKHFSELGRVDAMYSRPNLERCIAVV